MTNPERRGFIDRVKTIEERLLLIVNPRSKKGSEFASRVRSMVRREGMNLEETSTDHPDDLGKTIEFWSKRFGGSRVIMVFGGDGAINQVINNVMLSKTNKNVVLVPIPAGTANDFCRAMGFDTVERSLEAMVNFSVKSIDLLKMEVEGPGRHVKYCSNILGFGLDGDIAHQAQRYKRFGVLGYWFAAFRKTFVTLFTGVETYRLRVKVGDYEHNGKLVQALFSNIETYGRNLQVAPGARLDDGKIYISIARPMGTIKAFVTGLMLLRGQHGRMSTVDRLECESAEIELLDDLYAQEDGEVYFYPSGTRIRLSLERQALNVMTAPRPGDLG